MTTHDKLNAEDFHKNLDSSKQVIDVRTQDEFLSGTIPQAICIPHNELKKHLNKLSTDNELMVFCGSGKRSALACTELKELGFTKISELEGGFQAWNKSKLPSSQKRKAISLQRQVMMTAGLLITTSMLLGYFVNYGFFTLAAFVGLGLTFAGISGFCGMALLLEKMPWNKVQ